MKVLFLNPQQEMGGIQCLSAFLKRAGHETALVNDPNLFDNAYVCKPRLSAFFEEPERLLRRIEEHDPDLVALPVVTDDYKWALKWARRVKERLDVPIVFGNVHATFHAPEVLKQDCVDFVVRGEGEHTLLELVECLEGKRRFSDVLGLAYKEGGEVRLNELRPLIEDLDELPFPDKDLYYAEIPQLNVGYTTMTGRGCPYKCTFCDNNTAMQLYREGVPKRQRWTRRHSPEYVVREILWAKERWGVAHVRFNDEDFSYDKRWTREFCALWKKEVGLPYFAWVYPNTIDPEIARLMADSGCDSVEMGIQSGSERLRRELLHRHTTDDQIAAAMKALVDAGIKTKVDVILGLPTEDKADLDATVRLLSRGEPWHVFVFWLQYYPATELLEIAKRRGFLSPEQLASLETLERDRGSANLAAPSTGFWTPDIRQDGLAHRYLTFIVLMPLMPKALVRFLLRRDLIRFFPRLLNTFLLSKLVQALKPQPFDEFLIRGRRVVLAECARLARRTLARARDWVLRAPKSSANLNKLSVRRRDMNTRARAASAISLCAAVIISAVSASAATRKIDWVLAHNQLDYLDDAVKEFKAAVEKGSKGELEINVVRQSQADVAAMVRDGRAQMGHSFADAASSVDPRLLAFDAPFLHRGYEHMEGVIEGPVGRGLLEGLREKGMVGLALTYSGGANGVASKRELREPGDLRGLKVGVYGHAVDTAWLEKLGAVPVAIGHRTDEIAAKARAGELDAVVLTWRNYQREELENVLGRVGLMGVSYLVSVTFVNEKFFASLPKAHRELLQKAALEVARVERARTIQLNESSRLTAVARGARETKLTAEERAAFVRATEPAYGAIEKAVGAGLVGKMRRTADGAIPEAAGELTLGASR